MLQFEIQTRFFPLPATAELGFAHNVGRAGLGVALILVSLPDPHPNPPHRGEGIELKSKLRTRRTVRGSKMRSGKNFHDV